MAKSLHELSPRTQLIVFGLLSLLGVGAAWQVMLGPAQSELASRQARLTTLEGDVARAQGVAARLPAAQREVAALEVSLRETQAVIPEEKDPQDVLRNLHEVAMDSQIALATFIPKPISAKAQYSEWPISLGLESSYHDLGRFFDRIASMPRLMSVSDLQIKVQIKPNVRSTVTASCVATTFVFKKEIADAAPAKPAEASAGGKQ